MHTDRCTTANGLESERSGLIAISFYLCAFVFICGSKILLDYWDGAAMYCVDADIAPTLAQIDKRWSSIPR